MTGPKAFRATLQELIDPTDNSWSYDIPNLPPSQQSNAARLIKYVSFVSSDSKQHMQLRFQVPPENRATRGEQLDRLLLISFSDFRLRWPSLADGILRTATAKETGDYITRLLVAGLSINGVQYHFFGHSNSQLKSRSCFMYAASKAEISAKIEAMGDLSKLKTVGKKAKRIGLLFSSAEMALSLDPSRCKDIEDVTLGDYIFTDGCGLISTQLASQLVQRRKIVFRGQRYMPSVFQIRYRGYKGVLTLDSSFDIDPTLNKQPRQLQVLFRDSMRKFKDAPDHTFSVVDYSKPYAFGSLNDEVVILLHTLGVSQETLLRKQVQHLEFLRNVSRCDVRAAFQFLSYCNQLDVAEKLLFNGIESVTPTLQSLVKREYARMLNKREEQRCHILIPQSRLLFGVCDPGSINGRHGKLRNGECFVRITQDGDGKARTIINTEVLVTRNPCLHPGDLQKFKAVDVPEYAHLVDCIVFPTRGKRPSADLMSGGDLDGDKFFVTWDPDVIPKIISEPAAYPGAKEPPNFKRMTEDDRAEYFARYTNASLGRVKNLYIKWARLGNAMSSQCQQLNRLFSQCVDGNRIKIPQELEDPPEPSDATPPFILDTLHSSCTKFIENSTKGAQDLYDDHAMNVPDLLLSRDKFAMSEFELLQLTLRWCDKNGVDIMEYAHFFNFSALSDEQQIWFLGRLSLKSEPVQSLIRNGLMQSDLVTPQELRRFRLDHPCLHWKPVFNSTTDRMGRFISTACRSLELFHKTLIVLSVDERLTLAIYIPEKIQRASEVQVDSSVRIFALPKSQGSQSAGYKVLPTKKTYRVFCDENSFQLYQLKRSNTWIFINRSQMNDAAYRNEKNRGDRRRKQAQTLDDATNFDCRISVALDKIGKDIQTHVGRLNRAGVLGAEIYVISNRDVQSMNLLDQWLHYIDTEEILPLFERLETDYSIPKLEHIAWETYPQAVAMIVRDKTLLNLRLLNSIVDLETVLDLLETHGEKSFLRDLYVQLLTIEVSSECAIDGIAIASTLLQFLPRAVYLIPAYLQSQTWRNYKPALEDVLIHLAPTLLSELVLSTNTLEGFVQKPFSLLLHELKQISLQSFAELVELIALSVQSAEAALDLLLEILEPESSRLLAGGPLVVAQFIKAVFGIALDHIDEASNNRKVEKESLKIALHDSKDGFTIVKASLRIDSNMGSLKVGDHVRFTVSNPPQNTPFEKPFSMDAVVLQAGQGSAMFRCLHKPPGYTNHCAWNITLCGSFVTSKTMFDAVTSFYTEREACCRVFGMLVGLQDVDRISLPNVTLSYNAEATLNESQNAALAAAMTHCLTFIWGPPGTGKTHTVVVILMQLLNALPQSRFLVTAPTHNAVDNMLRRFLKDGGVQKTGVGPVRVSTQFSKVSSDLCEYTCDAMLGKDVSANFPARRQAERRIKQARLIFSTCAGSGLGLLRSETFGVVLVDEASQQTEPQTLIPLVKGCSRAILVGDHVQLRATVQKNAVLMGFDISLFERHYNLPLREGVAKVMLDTQYRMHRSICDFSSQEFYHGKLKTEVRDSDRPIPPSQFPWPKNKRMVFIECGSPEDLGARSKTNVGQIQLCKRVIQLLSTPPIARSDAASPSTLRREEEPKIAILTPYARQKEALGSAIPGNEVCSIDGYQGREADIVVYVTVRSNLHGEMGFLTDMRRLNVVMTRAKRGAILIGNKATLTGKVGDADQEKEVWGRLIARCELLKELPEVRL